MAITMTPEALIGTIWRHKRKKHLYRLEQTRMFRGGLDVYLHAETKGARSTWKYSGLLEYDYECLDSTPRPGAESDPKL